MDTESKKQLIKAVDNLFEKMRKLNGGNTTAEKKIIIETVINSLPHDDIHAEEIEQERWELHQKMMRKFNI